MGGIGALRRAAPTPAGDHTLLIAEVLALHLHRDTLPLIFYRGGYHGISAPGSVLGQERA